MLDGDQSLLMELEDVHKNSEIKRHNSIEFGLVWFILISTFVLDGYQGLMMMELEDVKTQY